jgi:hypothetical protein
VSKNPFAGEDLETLQTKRWLTNIIIKQLKGPWSKDPRAKKVLPKYRLRHRQLNEAILAERLRQGPLPPPTVVNLKAAKMVGVAKQGGV